MGWILGMLTFWLWPDQQTWLSGAPPSEFGSDVPLPASSWHGEQTRGSTRVRRRIAVSSRVPRTTLQTGSLPHGSRLQGKRCVSFYLPCLRPSPLNHTEQKDASCAYCPHCAAVLTQHSLSRSAWMTWRVYAVWIDQLFSLQWDNNKSWYINRSRTCLHACKNYYSWHLHKEESSRHTQQKKATGKWQGYLGLPWCLDLSGSFCCWGVPGCLALLLSLTSSCPCVPLASFIALIATWGVDTWISSSSSWRGSLGTGPSGLSAGPLWGCAPAVRGPALTLSLGGGRGLLPPESESVSEPLQNQGLCVCSNSLRLSRYFNVSS